MMLGTRIIHIYRVLLYTNFQRMKLYGQIVCVSIVVVEEILLFSVVGLILRTGFEDGCYKRIPLVKSWKDKQWTQLKRMQIKGPVPRPTIIVQHSFFSAGKRRIVSSLLFFISRARDVPIVLVFPRDYICAFLIVWKSNQLYFPSYFNNKHIICNKVQLISWADRLPVAWTVRNLWRILTKKKHKLEAAVFSLNLGFRKSTSRAINSPCSSETKSSHCSDAIVITALQRNKRRNTSFIELDGDESKCCVKVDTYEI